MKTAKKTLIIWWAQKVNEIERIRNTTAESGSGKCQFNLCLSPLKVVKKRDPAGTQTGKKGSHTVAKILGSRTFEKL